MWQPRELFDCQFLVGRPSGFVHRHEGVAMSDSLIKADITRIFTNDTRHQRCLSATKLARATQSAA